MCGPKLKLAGKLLRIPILILSNIHAQISFKGFFGQFLAGYGGLQLNDLNHSWIQ
jgi:hypothetical protein